ncbi:MAG: DUF1592 domain-containing protein [Deltaproteobacteria bacterium]|nr:DUF1592 domain-containing protein [Deltaproteobacteria bacterium]MBK8713886.1 DUF1592 domain-containing protein [Deltaproteobacteria bacterium]MBP7290555.1 DUF1592 domain-containing protein [Nannocystaceae bacterium]
MRARSASKTLGLGVAAGLLSAFTLNACNEAGTTEDQCVSNEDYFKEKVWSNILGTTCIKCHSDTGAAKDSSFILRDAKWGPDYLENNLKVFESMAKLQYEGTPWILVKPSMDKGITHGGAMQLDKGSEQYKAFQGMIDRLENPVTCADDGEEEAEFFSGVELLDEVATLRKASLSIAGRLPTPEEEQRVRDGGFEALDGVLDDMMTEDAFYDRLKEIYNDHFLTDRYYPNTMALDLLEAQNMDDNEIYPYVRWYENEPDADTLGRFSNQAVAREALELVAYVVRNNKPFTEILTADYTMVNPYSAKVYGLQGVQFQDPSNYTEFAPAKIPGIPHAGVMTTTVFLNRFPTTETNRNRHRSRIFYKYFLATDVLKLGERPVQSSAILGVAPWLNNSACSVCHEQVDPVAGAFQNFGPMGEYQPPEMGWFGDMKAPGYGDVVMPPEEYPRALNWLAGQAAQDRRFAVSAIDVLYHGLSGDDPLEAPSDPSEEGYLEGIRAADMQAKTFDGIAQKFIDSNYNLKTVVKELVKTPYYRAYNAEGLDETRETELSKLGTGRLLIPEQLNRKIEAVTGQPWRVSAEDTDLLLDDDQYKIFYGGIDSDTVVERITTPNGIIANTAKRMGNEIACWSTAADFTRAPGDRRLFPYVDPSFEPEDGNGFEVPAAASSIRANMQYLHAKLLGEYLDQNDPEINRTYELFLKVWKEGQRGMATTIVDENGNEVPEYGPQLPGQCQATADFWSGAPLNERSITEDRNYTIRAWMAVVSYLLSDYRFLHE